MASHVGKSGNPKSVVEAIARVRAPLKLRVRLAEKIGALEA